MSDNTRIGATVAGYRIQSLIGRGGMSIVYLAEHVQLGRQVALKLLAPSLSADPEFRERFAHESRRAAEVDHPNVVPIFDAGEADGQLFIAMRYVEGCDLKTLIHREGGLGVERTLQILEQAADGLDAAHERNLIHRDVKPANILVSEPSGHVYLTDFGVVKHTAAQGLTKTGFFLGTVDYAAPEQIEGLPVDARTDVYALGCVLYECLAGQAPFERDGELAVMHAHLVQPPPVLPTAPALPEGLDAVIAKAMAKAKDERYETCGDVVSAARQAAFGRRSASVSTGLGNAPAVAAAGAAATHDPPEVTPSPVDVGGAAATHVPPAAPVPAVTPAAPPAAAVPPPAAEPPPSAVPPPPAGPPPSAAPPPPAAPPPLSGSSPRAGRRGPSPLVIVVIAVVAALASGVATYLATRGSGSSNPGSTLAASAPTDTVPNTATTSSTATTGAATTATTSSTTTTGAASTATTTNPALTGAAGALVAKFADPAIAASCKKSPHPGGKVTLNCTTTTPAGKPVALHIDLFGSSAIVTRNYSSDALGPFKAGGGVRNSGACTKAVWSGEGPWQRGRRACFVAKSTAEGCKGLGAPECSIVYWYDEPAHVAVRATVPGPQAQSAPQLAVWWNAHKGDFAS